MASGESNGLFKMKNFLGTILLTGAGFTRNFGGLLASEMADSIYNSNYLRGFPEIKKILHNISNYEEFYEKVIIGDYSPQQKDAVVSALSEAYERIDKAVREWSYLSDGQVNIYGVRRLLGRFAGEANQCGFFFTLNQDLFAERQLTGDVHLEIPCVSSMPRHKNQLGPSDYVTLPTCSQLDQKLNDPIHPLSTGSRTLYFVKLHGSHNWLSSWLSPNGSRRMVIGPDKEGQINREPLLKWYKEIFKMVLGRGGVKLLVIGYSFRDEHINNVIADAIMNQGLELYVVCPDQRVDFIGNLRKCPHGQILMEGLDKGKFWCGDLYKIFPGNQSTTDECQEIRRSLFP
jgi:hypothetical protein